MKPRPVETACLTTESRAFFERLACTEHSARRCPTTIPSARRTVRCGIFGTHREKSRKGASSRSSSPAPHPGFPAIDACWCWRSSCDHLQRAPRVSSSCRFHRADTGRRPERRAVVQRRVSFARGGEWRPRAPASGHVARHDRKRQLRPAGGGGGGIRPRGRTTRSKRSERATRRRGPVARIRASASSPDVRPLAVSGNAPPGITARSRPPNLSLCAAARLSPLSSRGAVPDHTHRDALRVRIAQAGNANTDSA